MIDGVVPVLRNERDRNAGSDFRGNRQRVSDEARLSGAGRGKLRGLADILAANKPRCEIVPLSCLLQHLPGGTSVRCYLGIGNSHMVDVACGKRISETGQLTVDGDRRAAWRHKSDAPAREDRRRALGSPFVGEPPHALLVGSEKQLIGCAVLYLVHKTSRGGISEPHALAGLLLEGRCDVVQGIAQARRRRHDRRGLGAHLLGQRAGNKKKRARGQHGQRAPATTQCQSLRRHGAIIARALKLRYRMN